MSFYTTLFSRSIPNGTYHLNQHIILIPGGINARKFITPGGSGTEHGGTLHFYTNAETSEEHNQMLRNFVIVYSFLFNEKSVYHFHSGELMNHIQVESYKEVPSESYSDTQDFDNVLPYVYHAVSEGHILEKISFSSLYSLINEELINNLILFLDNFNAPRSHSEYYRIFNHSYLEIANYLTLLEMMIKDDIDCKHEAICGVCGRNIPSHKKTPTREWLKKSLSDIIKNGQLVDEYEEVITSCRKQIRPKAVHNGKLPTKESSALEPGITTYNFEKSKKEFEKDNIALNSIVLHMRSVIFYLMLHRFFHLNYFFPMQPLNVMFIPGRDGTYGQGTN